MPVSTHSSVVREVHGDCYNRARMLNVLIAISFVLPTDFWRDWQQDLSRFVRDDLPKVGGVLIEAVVLLLLLRVITHRLTEFSQRQTLPSHIRAQQLKTVA